MERGLMMRCVLVLLLSCLFRRIEGEPIKLQQTFRRQQPEIQAVEGEDVTLPCEINNLHGEVQWTLDGMALGYDSKIPGYPRYEMVGNRINGIFNLHIRNVSLEDDAEFQCQVGQKLVNNTYMYQLNKTVVKLNVISPPVSIEMIDRVNRSVASVPENSELRLRCLTRNSRPPAEIMWFRDRIRIREGYTNEVQECRTVPNKTKNVEKCDIMSTLIVRPSLSDESIIYSCHAKHEALHDKPPLFSSVQLSVLYPPDPPHIDSYVEGDQLQALTEGLDYELVCRSSGGNPLAELSWYKNGVKLQKDSYYKTFGKVSQSSLKINLGADDNEANYTCESKNGALKTPLKTTVKLSVSFGPENIDLVGPDNSKSGETITVECKSSSSYPAAEIQWVVDGHRASNKPWNVSSGLHGGFITTSWLPIKVPAEHKELTVHCYANNPRTSKNVVANKTVHIHYPPGAPVISGPVKVGFLQAGATQVMMCTSSGGNPLAELTWFKNNHRMNSMIKKSDRASSFAEITIVASKTDNGAVYKCEAKNPTIQTPLVDTVRLKVYFPPDDVKIEVQPSVLQVGTIARVYCNATSSNPPAEITWWKDNAIQITDGISFYSDSGQYGGKVTFSELQLNVTADMHNSTVTCRAINPVLQQGVNGATDLNVLYKPIFTESGRKFSYSKIEGESFSVMFNVHGNPSRIVYRWLKNERQLDGYEDSSLAFSTLSRNQGGFYTCEAENSQGSASISFELNVKYEAAIVSIKEKIQVKPGSDVEMSCTVTGNPIGADDVSWINTDIRDWHKRTSFSFYNNTSVLRLTQATTRDMGLFYCIVNNGIGAEKNASTRLIVEHAPVSNQTVQLIKVTPDDAGKAKFICQASGAPELNFSWFKNDTVLNRTANYDISFQRIDDLQFKSTLVIRRVRPNDYGKFCCIARNTISHVKITYELFGYSKPDQPLNLQVTNVTYHSVTLSWDLEFNGGLPPSFVIHYYPVGDEKEQHKEDAGNHTVFTVGDLNAGMNYIFGVKAKNKLGESAVTSINATTVAERPPTDTVEGEGLIILLMAAVVGVALLLCNMLGVFICWCRRCRKSKKEKPEMRNKSLELYAPASRSSNGMSMSTVSSLQSEKSGNFTSSDDNRNHINDNHHDLPLSYVIEDINYPFMEGHESETHHFKHDLDEKYIKSPYDRYSTLSHLHLHNLQTSLPSFGYDVSTVSDIVGTTTMPRKKPNHLPDLGYMRDMSPTPSLPPPMTTISTQPYRSLQPSGSFLRL